MLFDRKGRERLRGLLPARRDLNDPLRLFLFNLGLSEERPLLARWSYIEKSEYWALVWGSSVMIATGAVLIFHNAALAALPLWVIETSQVIHYMEAILACLSILVWHLYWVVYDPEVYPMNWAWLTGRSRLREPGKHDG
jgi:cytochrome b subunit of formate dehydrogenase